MNTDELEAAAYRAERRVLETDHTERPLLFLDVDGPLLPFGENPQRKARGTTSDSRLARLTAEVGRQLATLPCELVWATTWGDEANAEIAPRIGLPQLPVVNWPESSDEDERQDQWFGLHWKTRTLVTWAAGRPFAWVDDEITGADRDWVTAHHSGQALLHHVESSRGLAEEDFEALDQWLRAL
ncbi:HAD domain-containing protein [Microtetraspora malaysiensis]|uniref:HAD domain-containing protein n=1 Tax=Microtetraspora malaysiensis TaxID=161358 RepID=UPI003D90F282